MDIESLRATLGQASLGSLGFGFLLGFVFTFNPVALASIPVALAYVPNARAPKTPTVYGGLFIVRTVIVQTLLRPIDGVGESGPSATGAYGLFNAQRVFYCDSATGYLSQAADLTWEKNQHGA